MANINGNPQNNLLTGTSGNDVIDGRGGVDTITYAGAGAMRVDLTAGTATGQGSDTLINIESIIGSGYGDVLQGNAINNSIDAGAGNDTVYATLGVDTLNGGSGTDTLSFGTWGPNGASVSGSLGNVTASLAAGAYTISTGNYGSLSNFETLIGGAGNDSLTGNSGANVLDGGRGNDFLAGGLGNDTLYGGRGSDRLVADGGTDIFYGHKSLSNEQTFEPDVFEVKTTASAVTVMDFKRGIDKLDLTDFHLDSQNPYWTATSALSGRDTSITLSGQSGETVSVLLKYTTGYMLTLNDFIGVGTVTSVIPAQPVGTPNTFIITPQATGTIVIPDFEDGYDLLDLSFLNTADWQGGQAAASDGSVLFMFDSPSLHMRFSVNLSGVNAGEGLINQADIIF